MAQRVTPTQDATKGKLPPAQPSAAKAASKTKTSANAKLARPTAKTPAKGPSGDKRSDSVKNQRAISGC